MTSYSRKLLDRQRGKARRKIHTIPDLHYGKQTQLAMFSLKSVVDDPDLKAYEVQVRRLINICGRD